MSLWFPLALVLFLILIYDTICVWTIRSIEWGFILCYRESIDRLLADDWLGMDDYEYINRSVICLCVSSMNIHDVLRYMCMIAHNYVSDEYTWSVTLCMIAYQHVSTIHDHNYYNVKISNNNKRNHFILIYVRMKIYIILLHLSIYI